MKYPYALLLMVLLWSCQRGPVYEFEWPAEASYTLPATVALPQGWEQYAHFELVETQSGEVLGVQPDGQGRLVFMPAALEADGPQRYALRPAAAPAGPAVHIQDDGRQLSVLAHGQPLLNYHTAVVMPPEGLPAYYRRSGFIHPLYTPQGKVLTDAFPPDHAHQHAIFFAWVNTLFQGRNIDFWNQHKRTGAVSHTEVLEMQSGPVFSRFRVRLQHQDLSDSSRVIPVLNETWTVTAYHLQNEKECYLIDLLSEQQCAGDSALHLLQYHYGGMAFRGSGQWYDPGYERQAGDSTNLLGPGRGGFLTSEGKTRMDGNHSRPRWVSVFGHIDGAACGVTLLDHPSNFRFPQPVRLHPSSPYFSFSPTVLGPFDIRPGEVYRSRYRILAFDGEPDTAWINRMWKAYSGE